MSCYFQAGTKLGVIYAEYFKNGIPVSNEHLIGHDIGAHLIGQAGRTIITSSNGAYKLDRWLERILNIDAFRINDS